MTIAFIFNNVLWKLEINYLHFNLVFPRDPRFFRDFAGAGYLAWAFFFSLAFLAMRRQSARIQDMILPQRSQGVSEGRRIRPPSRLQDYGPFDAKSFQVDAVYQQERIAHVPKACGQWVVICVRCKTNAGSCSCFAGANQHHRGLWIPDRFSSTYRLFWVVWLLIPQSDIYSLDDSTLQSDL